MTDESAGYVTIGEAALRSGLPPKTIRFYAQIGLIRPAQRFANQYRAYSEKDVHTLKFVHRARNLGFSLKHPGGVRAPLPRKAAEALAARRREGAEGRDPPPFAWPHLSQAPGL